MSGLPRYLSDRGISRALQARCTALHFLSHHREQGPDPARISQSHQQPHLWLRRLPGGLPLDQVRAMFTKSPVKRIGRDRFMRNVLIAIGISNDRALAAEAERLLGDESPLVRGAAVWALSQLLGREEFDARSADALTAEP